MVSLVQSISRTSFLSFSVAAAHQYTLGHLLITGFLSKDTVASWCSNIALAHLLADHQQYKEALLQVVLAVDQAQAKAKSLMEMSVDLLENVSIELLELILCTVLILRLPHRSILEWRY